MPVALLTGHENAAELLQRYREAAAGTRARDPEKANRCYDSAHACYKVLRETEAGRLGHLAPIDDEDPYVRCSAAAHSLQWVPENARPAFEALRNSHGDNTFGAKMILLEFDKGRLSFDF